MKSTTAYYLLLLYTLALFKPVLPLVQDELAHLFAHAHHLATVHHDHGDHHAAGEVTEALLEQEEHPGTDLAKSSTPVSIHIIVETEFQYLRLPSPIREFGIAADRCTTIPVLKHYPPPKSC
ncbi:hypothetical protein EXU57_17170 [Segetibacter sp. 3557_3]|uniref:hypothetical protein n=1 Tax=Segetibacter sp. 3557_3 TaxID=2547429 RepID=UPI0010590C1F|nr:hypothetical protein [Segetibacter sp. 3557_3]TDH23532.1 hypothetical protein EXU57_17170 [Segetibacter sp. 3557_3]